MPGHSTSALGSAATPASPDVALDEVLKRSRADVLNTLVEPQPARPSARHMIAVAAVETVAARLVPVTTIPRSTCEQCPPTVIASEDRQSQGTGSVGVVLQPCIQQVILPDPVDAKITARVALAFETGFLEQANRRRVVRYAGGFQPVQPKRGEAVRDQRPHGGSHVAFAREALPDPVANAARLSDATANIGKCQPTHHRVVFAPEDQKGIGKIAALVLCIALEPPPKGATREIVGRPRRFPRHEEIAAGCAQSRPFGKIAAVRRPQSDAGTRDARDDLVEADGSEECHGRKAGRAVQAARRNRLSAIAAVLARPLPGPSAAIAGFARPISAAPAARALATVTASTFATISSSGIGLP